MKNKIPFLSLVLFSFSFLQMHCKNNIVTLNDELKQGRRDYQWTIDTLKPRTFDSFTPARMWGSSSTDVWVTGYGSSSVSLLYHFDGNNWKRDTIYRMISPSALWGTSHDNVWLGNSNSTIWRYDGINWTKQSEYKIVGYDKIYIECIWGRNAADVYGVGSADQGSNGDQYKGVIMHFDGIQWQFINMLDIRIEFTGIAQQYSSGLLFLEGTRFETSGDTSKLFLYDGRNYRLLYSGIKYGVLENMRGEIYYVNDKIIYKYSDSTLKVWKNFSNTSMLGRMIGRSEKDFFTFTQEDGAQGIAHYNGDNLQTIYKLPDNYIVYTAFLLEKDFFVVCQSITSNLNIVVHGTLQSN